MSATEFGVAAVVRSEKSLRGGVMKAFSVEASSSTAVWGPRKRVVCLIHVPKAAGSSAWTTLANLPETAASGHIATADAYADACLELGTEDPRQTPTKASEALAQILQRFRETPKATLLVHHHTPGLPALPDDMDFDLVFVVRDPEDRWRSGLRHWLGGAFLSRPMIADYPDRTAEARAFAQRSALSRAAPFGRYMSALLRGRQEQPYPFDFLSSLFSWSADVHLRSAFGPRWHRRTNFGMPANVRVFAFETRDLIAGGAFCRFFSRSYGITPFSIQQFEGTVTQRGRFKDAEQLLLDRVPGFALVLGWRVRAERKAIRRLLALATLGEPVPTMR